MIILAIILACLGIGLLVHHGYHHSMDEPNSHVKSESCVCVCYFQPKDIFHCEALILVCITNAICIGLEQLVVSLPQEAKMAAVILGCGGLLLVLVYTFCIRNDGSAYDSVLHNISNHETWILVCFTCTINLTLLNHFIH